MNALRAACRQGLWLAVLLFAPALSWAQTMLPASGSIEVAFSPWDDAEGAIIKALQQARRSIRVQAYIFTSRPLAQALLAAHRRGIEVIILTDAKMLQQTKKGQIPVMAQAGIPVWLETRHATAHNKLMLIDVDADVDAGDKPQQAQPVVITGSYNFTYAAQARNAENLLLLRGNPALAAAYLANWQRHHAEAIPYTTR